MKDPGPAGVARYEAWLEREARQHQAQQAGWRQAETFVCPDCGRTFRWGGRPVRDEATGEELLLCDGCWRADQPVV